MAAGRLPADKDGSVAVEPLQSSSQSSLREGELRGPGGRGRGRGRRRRTKRASVLYPTARLKALIPSLSIGPNSHPS